MQEVRILTVRRAAVELGWTRHVLASALLARDLTTATVDDKPAVLIDEKFRKLKRAKSKAAA